MTAITDSSSLALPATVECAWLLDSPGLAPARTDVRIALARGRVASITDGAAGRSSPRLLALPALSNAHDHARTFRSSTVGAYGWPLESWLPMMGTVPGLDPYLCAATSLARSAHAGVANVMVHYTRTQGGMSLVEEARAVARAARDVGVRIGFAVAMRDRNGIAYCDDATVLAKLRPAIRPMIARRMSVDPVDPARQVALADDVAAMIASEGFGEHVNVQYGPTAAQWCSTPLLEAIAQASADSGRGVHMHMLETPYQRAWADEQHPQGLVAHLDSIGLLSPRLTLAHCVHARPDELALLAERGVTIAVNTSSNLALKSGVAPVAEMFKQGCRVAMGLDGSALDEDDDALRELRLGYALHRGWGYDTTAMDRRQLWAYASANGARSVNGLGVTGFGKSGPAPGKIEVGSAADIVLLNWDAIDDESLFGDVDPFDLVMSRANKAHVDTMLVGGRPVVAEGKIVGIDEAAMNRELLSAARAALAADASHLEWRNTVKQLAEDLSPFFSGARLAGCC